MGERALASAVLTSDVVKRVQQSQSQRAGLVRSIGARLRVQGLRRSTAFISTVDSRHARLFVALAGCRGEIVEACNLLHAQLDSVGCRVLLDAGDSFGAGDRGDVVALREQPGQSNLCRCRADLGSDGLDLVDDAEVLLEVALGEA